MTATTAQKIRPVVLGIDPGANTGFAIYRGGHLAHLQTIRPHQIGQAIAEAAPDRVVFEDSRLQSHTWTTVKSRAAALKMARNVGQVDAICSQIDAICDDLQIQAHGISPARKGAKVDAESFRRVTGWTGSSNEHTRDAAMVAWPYRRAGS